MELTRNQADLALRHYTAEYAEQALRIPENDTPVAIGTLTRELSWRIDADVDQTAIEWLLVAWRDVFDGLSGGETGLNFEVNDILDTAGFPGPHILRYSEQVAA